jgi:hypothetical protein
MRHHSSPTLFPQQGWQSGGAKTISKSLFFNFKENVTLKFYCSALYQFLVRNTPNIKKRQLP